MVDAKDEKAADFYAHHGFIAFIDTPLTLFLPLATVRDPATSAADEPDRPGAEAAKPRQII